MVKRGRNSGDKEFVLHNSIKVMVVDNNKVLLAYVGDSLKAHSFEVTCVDRAGAALKILTESEDKYDLLFVDSKLKEVDVITFLRFTKQMDIPLMVMHEEADDNFVFEMIVNGAFLVVKRPLSDDAFLQAKECVIRKRLNMFVELESDFPATGKKKVTMSNIKRNSNLQFHENGTNYLKMSVDWTKDLHCLFLRVAHKLAAEGRCFPRDILEAMGVPGLTRMQVASHLQKCRLGGPKFNGNQVLPRSARNGSSNGSEEEVNSRRHGHSPLVATSFSNQEKKINFFDCTYSRNGVEKDNDRLNSPRSFISSSSMKNYGSQNIGKGSANRCKKTFQSS